MKVKCKSTAVLAVIVCAMLSCMEQKMLVKDFQPAKFEIPSRIKKVAVVGFKEKENLGDVVIGKLSNKIQESKRFEIFDRDSLNMILAEKNLQEADLAEESKVQDMKLGAVDALITGEIRTTWREEKFTEIKYAPGVDAGGNFTMKPTPVESLAQVAELTLNVKMLDLGNKARVIAQQSYSKGFHSKKDKKLIDRLREERRDVGVTPAGIFELLIDDCCTDFAALIIPHYKMVPVVLMQGSATVNQGVNFMQGGNYEDAEASFKAAMAAEPGKIEPVYDLAVCYEFAKRYDEALDFYRKSLAMKPGYKPSADGINRVREKTRKPNNTGGSE